MPYLPSGPALVAPVIPAETFAGVVNNGVSAPLAGGGFVLAWTNDVADDGGADPDIIRIQRFDAQGVALGPAVEVNSAASGAQSGLALTALAGGGFAVAWAELSAVPGDGFDIHAAVFDAEGARIGGERVLNTTASSDQHTVQLASLADGGFAAVWAEEPGGPAAALRGATFDAAGQPAGAEFAAGTAESLAIGYADFSLKADPDGHFTVTGNGTAHSFDADGTLIATGPEAATITELADGRSVEIVSILISEEGGGSTAPNDDIWEVYAQFHDADGNALGDPVLIAQPIGEFVPLVLATPDGGFLLGIDEYEYGGAGYPAARFGFQAFDGSGQPLGAQQVVNPFVSVSGFKPHTSFFLMENGDLVVTWPEDFPATQSGVNTQIFAHSPDVVIGDDGPNLLTGTEGGETIDGAGGDDTILGLGGNDVLIGGAGNDKLDGGAGNDTASYADAAAGVTVALRPRAQDTRGAGTDTLTGIENLTGSGHDDKLTGDGLANRLVGGDGNDLLKGLGGNDVLVAGAGSDNLVGGDGADTFVLGLPAALGERDRIVDFKPGDHIGIDADIFTQLGDLLVPGLDPSDFFSIYPETVAIGPRATNEWEFLVFDPRTHRLYYDADGSGAGAQVEIATVLGTTLSADDFLLLA